MANQIRRFKESLRRAKGRLLKIPAVQLIYRTAEKLGDIDATHRAAAVAYYAFLSIFPLVMGLIAIFGFFLPSVDLQAKMLNYVGDNIPGATNILNQNIDNIIRMRGTVGVISIVILFWGASAMFGAISLAINRAWDIRQYRRSFFIRKASELGMVSGIGILFLLSLGASAIISVIFRALKLPAADMIIVNISSRLVAFLLILAVFLLLYKLIPNTRTYWRDIWPGALLAAILFEIARTLFIIYINNYANYQLIYGSIASIIVLLVWIYYSAFIMILGAVFTFQYGRMRRPVIAGSGAVK
ncbi:MAG: YihY/virulence factor BrkB family protein [Dehalococcoidales bacterium]